uniref:G domain-containing protein n=1 Tax=Panagrolaimus sp. ES5 TaxID=591445 RepID=A0AC34F1J3_9BILA
MSYKTTKKDSIPTPNPTPARGVYGFALYIVSWILFLIYLFWAIIPSQFLEALHLTFLPSKQNSAEFGSITRAEERISAAEEARKNQIKNVVEEEKATTTSFPYNIEPDESMFDTSHLKTEEKIQDSGKLIADKGFFVQGNEYLDDYVAATAADLPEDDMNESPYRFVGDENAFETIEFQDPGQRTIEKGKFVQSTIAEDDEEEWKANYSTEDASVTIEVKTACSGCGAKFHCQDSALPGFIPVEVLQNVVEKEEKNARRKVKIDIDELCRRCYMLKHHNFLLNVNVCEVDYERMMGHLKLIQEALILLVVDMTDISGSIYRQLPNIIGTAKPMIVIGNKIDLLPPDARSGFLRRYRDALIDALNESGLSERFNIMHTTLVSAKTGYGIEDLITNIYLKWMDSKGALRSDIYLVGCTNAGKSTLFNSFLQSDLCKVRALDLVERVTTSVWPGTTLSLLKFPLMNPSTHRL